MSNFPPPYCLDESRIGRIQQDLHASVTRNHRRRILNALPVHVHGHLPERLDAEGRVLLLA